jgi:transposase
VAASQRFRTSLSYSSPLAARSLRGLPNGPARDATLGRSLQTFHAQAYILLLAREVPVARLARLVGETDTRLWRLIKAHVQKARAGEDYSTVVCVGVDEMAVRKGHHYLSVFADLIGRRVLFGAPGKDASVFDRFAEDLHAHNGHPHAILEMSMDMSHAYRKGVAENCRNARIVYDKYHVIANVNAAVDQVRRAESLGPAWMALRKTMWLWRKNPDNLDAQESARLQELQSQRLWTARAYQMRLSLQEIYDEEDPVMARQRLLDWCQLIRQTAQTLPKILFASMLGVAKMIENHLEGIMAHWTHKVTNAYMEGLNSVFSATNEKREDTEPSRTSSRCFI